MTNLPHQASASRRSARGKTPETPLPRAIDFFGYFVLFALVAVIVAGVVLRIAAN